MLVAVSGRDEGALREQAARWAAWVRDQDAGDGVDLGAVAATAARHREHHPVRAAVVASSAEELAGRLDALAADRPGAGVVRGTATGGPVALLFPGQGSQRERMGALRRRDHVFGATFDSLVEALDDHMSGGLSQVLGAKDAQVAARIHETAFTQPALFAFHVAAARTWQDRGIEPSFVVGHSIGEVAAAHVAGVLGIECAARLVTARGRLMQACRADGAMASLELTADEAVGVIAGRAGRVGLAGVNGERLVVVSGDRDAVEELVAEVSARGRRARALQVSHAFHSHHMDEMLDEYAGVAASCDFQAPDIPVVSTVTGELMTFGLAAGQGLRAPAYWVRQVREPVRFADAVGTLLDAGVATTLECGPTSVLSATVAGTAASRGAAVHAIGPDPRLADDERAADLAALGTAHAVGAQVDVAAVTEPDTTAADLPTYPFQRERLWIDPVAGDRPGRVAASTGHPWLHHVVPVADEDRVVLTGRVDLAEAPWLGDHEVFGATVVPGAGVLDLAVTAADLAGAEELRSLQLHRPLVLGDDDAVELQVSVDLGPDRRLELWTRPAAAIGDRTWHLHASGRTGPVAIPDPERVVPSDGRSVDPSELRAELGRRGVGYGEAFGGLEQLRGDGGRATGRVRLPGRLRPVEGDHGFRLHPALLDAALHVLGGLEGPDGMDRADTADRSVEVPVSFDDVRVHRLPADTVDVRAQRTGTGVRVELVGPGEELLVDLVVTTQPVRPDQVALARVDDTLLRTDWVPVDAGADAGPDAGVPLVVDLTGRDDGPGDRVAAALDALQDTEGDVLVLTRGSVSVDAGDRLVDPAGAAVWGLVRSWRHEVPTRRVRLLDLDPRGPRRADLDRVLTSAAGSGEPELAARGDRLLAPRLRDLGDDLLVPHGDAPWQVVPTDAGRLDRLAVVALERAALGPHEVRLAVRAVGVNFRDALNLLGVVATPGLGLECAGVVVEAGAAVDHVNVGDRVMGLAAGAMASEVVTDARYVVPVPDRLTDAEAATVPLAYLTAYHGLVDLAGVQAGQRVLVHAGAGGVGMAAIALARHLGAEVVATASPHKWDALAPLGLTPDLLATSRAPGFAEGWEPVDVVLNSLTGAMVDETLGLVREGGTFLEIGKTDLRDASEVARNHPGVDYRPFDLMDDEPAELLRMLRAVAALVEEGHVGPLPLVADHVSRAPEVLRTMSGGHHVGKLVLTVPRALDPEGSVLVTGGSGDLARDLAVRLVGEHGARHLVLASRAGADGAGDLAARLHSAGARTVDVVSCDVGDRDDVRSLVRGLARPLTAVFHLAGVVDDGLLEGQDAARAAAVLRPKADAARVLHEETADQPLTHFVAYSSVAGSLGGAGQSTYAAANAALDALVRHRVQTGLPGLSLALGPVDQTGAGMLGTLPAVARERMAAAGLLPMSHDELGAALARALRSGHAGLVAARTDRSRLDPGASPLLALLARPAVRRPVRVVEAAPEGAETGLADLPPAELHGVLLDLVRSEVAGVLGLGAAADVSPATSMRSVGLDSLMAVELRNRLCARTGLDLPTTVAFDAPTPEEMARLMGEELGGTDGPDPEGTAPVDERDLTDEEIELALSGVLLD